MRRAIRRVVRWAVGGFCLLSLLACAGAGWLWWRGTSRADYWNWTGGGAGGPSADAMSGGRLLTVSFALDRSPEPTGWETVSHPGGFGRWWPGYTQGPGRSGFAFYNLRTVGPPQGRWGVGGRPLLILWVPHWFPVAATAVPPLLWLGVYGRRAWVHRRRTRLGLCRRCGYDLRASAGRCPECGTETKGRPGEPAGDHRKEESSATSD
jgi:hypothetical protein